jgi:hypothetical protein
MPSWSVKEHEQQNPWPGYSQLSKGYLTVQDAVPIQVKSPSAVGGVIKRAIRACHPKYATKNVLSVETKLIRLVVYRLPISNVKPRGKPGDN